MITRNEKPSTSPTRTRTALLGMTWERGANNTKRRKRKKKSPVLYTVLSINCAVTALCVCWLMVVSLIIFFWCYRAQHNTCTYLLQTLTLTSSIVSHVGKWMLFIKLALWSDLIFNFQRERFGMDGWKSCKRWTWRRVWAWAQTNPKEWNHFHKNKSIFHYHMKFDDRKRWQS